MFNIVLHEPEIPNNTGTIGRICVNMGAKLHLIKPLGFEINESRLRRAGLDYWEKLNPTVYENFDEFLKKNPFQDRFFFTTAKTDKPYFKAIFKEGDYFIFGKESEGLPTKILNLNPSHNITIPKTVEGRSLNIGVSVGIISSEWMRQNYDFFLSNLF